MSTLKPQVIGIIPARFGSTRFPGKPLIQILNKSLIQRTYESALRCQSLDHLIVATDDQRIYDHVNSFGGKVILTKENCPSGTDRLVDALQQLDFVDEDALIINIQGDEPCIEPDVIQKVIDILISDSSAVMSTAIMPLDPEKDGQNSSVVKCVIDQNQTALYFSRSLIPGNKEQRTHPQHIYYKHLGIYGYRRHFLFLYPKLPPTPLQQLEDLEQLKVLEHGYKIKTAVVSSLSIGVDTPEDIKKVEQLLWKQNSFL